MSDDRIGRRGADAPAFISAMREIPEVVDARSDQRASTLQRAERENVASFIVDARPNANAAEKVARVIIDNGWGLSNLTPLPMTLEEIFLELTTEENLGE